MKNYDELLDDVAREIYGYDYDVAELKYSKGTITKIHREAAERYRAQVELPSDEEITEYAKKEASSFPAIGSIALGAKWMRDHISKQLKQGI